MSVLKLVDGQLGIKCNEQIEEILERLTVNPPKKIKIPD